MAKTNTKASKATATGVTAEPKIRATRNREAVLVLRTVQELVDLNLPVDAVIGVSRKSILAAAAKSRNANLKAELGL